MKIKKYWVLVFGLLMVMNAVSQPCDIKNLVFEGAGMRGLAYAGVVKELEAAGILNDVERVGGTSAGALTAMMISLGYTSEEINQILSETEFQNFNDGMVGAISRMKRNFGWFEGEKFTEWLEEHIDKKTGNSEITLQELVDQGFLPIYVTATCINRQELLILSHEVYPEMKVKDAVRASMSIPLYFKAVFIDSVGNSYPDFDDAPNLDILVDGGITGNYPIFLFDNYESEGPVERIPNRQTVGFRIDSREQISMDETQKELISQNIGDFKEYVTALYIFTLESLNRNQLTMKDWERTVSISSEGIGPMIKKFSREEKEALVNSGAYYTRTFLSEHGY